MDEIDNQIKELDNIMLSAIITLFGILGISGYSIFEHIFILLVFIGFCLVSAARFQSLPLLNNFINIDEVGKSYRDGKHMPIWMDNLFYGVNILICIYGEWYLIMIMLFLIAVFDYQLRIAAEKDLI